MRRSPLTVLLLTGCAYEAPLNPYAPEALNAITGEVIAGDVAATQPTLLFLADAANPMPPLGTGRPATFATVPGFAFSDPDAGLRSAQYAIPGVPDGTWILTGLMDMDRDFHPAVPTLAGATCGDRAGAHLTSLSGGAPAPLTVEGGEHLGDITVLLGAPLPFERPAFTVAVGAVSLSNPATWGAGLAAVPIAASYGEELSLTLTGPMDLADPAPCDTAFWRHFRDADADGVIDLHPDYPPEFGVLDVWPRVYLSWLGEPVDADSDGSPDRFDRGEEDGAWATAALPYAPCAPGTPACRPADAAIIGQPFPAVTLPAVFPGSAVRTAPDGVETVVTTPSDLPRGAWSVTVVLETGQTWTVPNELDERTPFAQAIPSPGVTSPSDPGQGTWVLITD